MGCAYCRQQRSTLTTAVATGNVKVAVATAVAGAGVILGMVSKPSEPTKSTGYVAGKKKD